jgi:lysyl-tRNA synthetase class 2
VNAFSELTQGEEQRERFLKEEAYRRSMGKPPYPMPEKFLRALSQMPESAGAALGVDRLIMLLTDADRIDDVVAFTPEDL